MLAKNTSDKKMEPPPPGEPEAPNNNATSHECSLLSTLSEDAFLLLLERLCRNSKKERKCLFSGMVLPLIF